MAFDIYSALAGPLSVPQRPNPMAMWQQAIQPVRDTSVPAAMSEWEAGLQADYAAARAASNNLNAFQEAVAPIPGNIGDAWRQMALATTDQTDVLGTNVPARMGAAADDIYASLALAGQDTGVAETVRQIGERSGRVLDAIGGAAIAEALSREAIGRSAAEQLNSIAAGQVASAGAGAQAAAMGAMSRQPDFSGVYADLNRSLAEIAEQEARRQQELEEREWEQRKFIAEMAMRMMENERRSSLDWARFGLDQQEEAYQQYSDTRDYLYDVQQDQAEMEAAAAEAEQEKREKKNKARKDAQKEVQRTLSDIQAEAVRYAADLAEQYEEVPTMLPGSNIPSGEKEKRPKYSGQQVYNMVYQRIRTMFADAIRRGAIKESRLRQIARDAVVAAGLNAPTVTIAPPGAQDRPERLH